MATVARPPTSVAQPALRKKSCFYPNPKIIRGAITRPVTPERSHHLRWFGPRLLGWCWSFQHSSSNHSYKECTSRHPRASHCEFMRAGGLVLYLGKMNSVLHILRPNPNFFSVALISSDILKPRQHTVLQDLLRAAHPAKATFHLINFKYVSHCWFHGCWLPFWLVFPWWAPVLVLMIHFLLDDKSHWFFLVWFFTMVRAWMNTKWKSAGLGDTSLAWWGTRFLKQIWDAQCRSPPPTSSCSDACKMMSTSLPWPSVCC